MSDPFDDLDRRLQRLAGDARASVSVPEHETEAALAEVTSGAHVTRLRPVGAPERGGPKVWLAAAAATALVATGGVWLLTRGPEKITTTQPTVPAPPPTAVVSVAPTPPSETLTTPPAATDVPGAPSDPFAGLARQPTGIARACGERGCTRVYADPDDVLYGCDPQTGVVTRYRPGHSNVSTPLAGCPVEIGPGEVAYVLTGDGQSGDSLTAVSVAAGDGGSELFEWSGVGVVDVNFVPTPDGIATMGVGIVDPQPDLTRAPAYEWVLPTPDAFRDFPVAQIEGTTPPSVITATMRWTLPVGTYGGVGWLSAVATWDGGMLATAQRDDDQLWLLRGWPDGTLEEVPLGAGPFTDLTPALLERSGTVIVADGDTFARVDPFDMTVAPPSTDPVSTSVQPQAVAPPRAGAWLGELDSERAGFANRCRADGLCTQLVFDPAGAPVTYDPVSRTVSRQLGDTGGSAEFVVDADGAPRISGIVAAGPGGVVYLRQPSDDPEAFDVVAYSLTATDAGREIARFPKALGLGDYDVVAGEDGLVMVGWYGQGLQPEATTPFLEWVGLDGAPIRSPRPVVRMDFYEHRVVFGDHEWTFSVPVDGMFPAMPQVVTTHDGGFMAVFYHGADGRWAVVRGWGDGTVETWTPPAGAEPWAGAQPDLSGYLLVRDGDWFVRAEVFPPRPADFWAGSLDVDVEAGTATAAGLADELASGDTWWEHDSAVVFANAVAGPTSPAERRSVELVDPDALVVAVTTEGLLDDSVAGVRLLFDLARTPDGWRVESIEWSQTCQPGRGQQDYQAAYCV